MDFLEKATGMNGRRLAFYEANLVYVKFNEVRRLLLDHLKYGLFHDLRQVRSHVDWSDLIERTGTLGKCLLRWYKPSNSQVLRDSRVIESICNLSQYLFTQLLIFTENVYIKAVRTKSLVKLYWQLGRIPSSCPLSGVY
jgi:hypothetical protein